MSYAVAECQTMSRLQPHQRLSFDGSSRSLKDGTSRRSSRDCSSTRDHNPRDRSPRDRSPRDRSPQRSPLRSRKAPSPLKHAQFRPLAMEYANSHANSPTSCKYYNAGEEEEPAPEGTQGEYCSTFRTVGYSTVGNKNFMSNKCPHCRRLVTSETQICTPNATPPQSPWKVALQSPLRSPLRTNRADGQTTLQSPIRSPFKGSFFGGPDEDTNTNTTTTTNSNKPTSPKRSASPKRSVSPKPSASTSAGRGASPTRSASPTRGGSAFTMASPIRSPLRGSFFEGNDEPSRSVSPKRSSSHRRSDSIIRSPTNNDYSGRSPSNNDHSARSPSNNDYSARSPTNKDYSARSPTNNDHSTRSPSNRDFSARSPTNNATSGRSTPVIITSSTTRSRSRSPTRSPRPIALEGATRGPRSPGPHSPAAARSPWKGGAFFGNPSQGAHEEEVQQAPSKSSQASGRSRGVHSPGPRSPLRVSVAFFDEEGLARQEEEERAVAAAAAAGTPKKKSGWRSPLRSPFKGYFGSSPKAAATRAKFHVGSE